MSVRENRSVLNWEGDGEGMKGGSMYGFQKMRLKRREGPGQGRDLGVYLRSGGSRGRRMNRCSGEVQHLDMYLVSSARLEVPDLREGDGHETG